MPTDPGAATEAEVADARFLGRAQGSEESDGEARRSFGMTDWGGVRCG